MPAKPETIDEYLSRLPHDQHVALTRLRQMIQDTAPNAVEAIDYSIPMFRLKGMLTRSDARKSDCASTP